VVPVSRNSVSVCFSLHRERGGAWKTERTPRGTSDMRADIFEITLVKIENPHKNHYDPFHGGWENVGSGKNEMNVFSLGGNFIH
jgi:hypothetical protein